MSLLFVGRVCKLSVCGEIPCVVCVWTDCVLFVCGQIV